VTQSVDDTGPAITRTTLTLPEQNCRITVQPEIFSTTCRLDNCPAPRLLSFLDALVIQCGAGWISL